jgi:hypothetical protein
MLEYCIKKNKIKKITSRTDWFFNTIQSPFYKDTSSSAVLEMKI